MKLTCCTWDCLLEHGAHSRHITQIGRNNWHIDVPWNIYKILYWICFFFRINTWFDIELHDILYSILCKLYILRVVVLDWHIHCARVWYEIIKLLSTAMTLIWDPASASMNMRKYQISCFFFLLIQDFVLKFWNLHYFHLLESCIYLFLKNCLDYWIVYTFLLISFFSFGWWYTLIKKKASNKPVFRPEKWPTFCR